MNGTKSGTGTEDRSRLTHRACLKATAAAGGAVLAPTIVPASALGRDGAVAPSERIVLGAIGIGSRGEHDLNWMLPEKDVQFVAICDVRKEHRAHVKSLVDKKYGNSDCKMYADMREFLASRGDIDALLIATGDRWHALATIMAMRAGKDVYSEKPSCMTIAEGRAVVQTARHYGRIYQTGTQRLSEGNFVAAIELARSGRLGKVHTARAHRPLGCRRDEPRMAPRRDSAAQGGSRLGHLAWPLPLAALQPRVRARQLARPLRLSHQLHR